MCVLNLPKKLVAPSVAWIITDIHGDNDMGIHYDYKSTRGDKKLRKQQEREERRLSRKREMRSQEPKNTVPEDVVLTLDMITDPDRDQ
jgi:hypothetical protein|tara:strand:+ start:576 stop:839 length:264 start_codon:yes stop_codon:yes gene_type:complete